MLAGMNEGAFWQLIEDCRPTESDPDTVLLAATLTERLAQSPLSLVIGFAEQLSWALHRLDRKEYRHDLGGDAFLYTRAAVVAAGRTEFDSVLQDPSGPSLLTLPISSGPSLCSTPRTGHTSESSGRSGTAIPATPTHPSPTPKAGLIERHGLQVVTKSNAIDRSHGMCATGGPTGRAKAVVEQRDGTSCPRSHPCRQRPQPLPSCRRRRRRKRRGPSPELPPLPRRHRPRNRDPGALLLPAPDAEAAQDRRLRRLHARLVELRDEAWRNYTQAQHEVHAALLGIRLCAPITVLIAVENLVGAVPPLLPARHPRHASR
ncbi:DUF4240 domain-containing protein [Streptomyces sp. WG7]|uniref:DUF4240 domain-containing protein n=1 Tax=Streptomyces sp. WG7 TaxID=3417650 RepID=UPI003CEA2BCE